MLSNTHVQEYHTFANTPYSNNKCIIGDSQGYLSGLSEAMYKCLNLF